MRMCGKGCALSIGLDAAMMAGYTANRVATIDRVRGARYAGWLSSTRDGSSRSAQALQGPRVNEFRSMAERLKRRLPNCQRRSTPRGGLPIF